MSEELIGLLIVIITNICGVLTVWLQNRRQHVANTTRIDQLIEGSTSDDDSKVSDTEPGV